MSLPNPSYLTVGYFNWNGSQADRILVDASPGGSPAVATGRRDIRWDSLNNTDKAVVQGLIMGYALRNSLTEANALTIANAAGYQTVDYEQLALSGNATGLANDATVYTMKVSVNGATAVDVSVVGSAAQTFGDLITALNGSLPATVVASIFDGNIDFTTATTGAGNTVEILDIDLLRSCAGFKQVLEKRVGIDTLADIFDLNYRNGYQSYAELLIGSLRFIPDKPGKNPQTDQDIYFNHSTAVWTFLHSDVAV